MLIFMRRRSILSILLYVTVFSSCCRVGLLYPLQGEDGRGYPLPLSKKDAMNSLKDSLFSAFILPDATKPGSPSQRKKAVDSTFIRFGRSSLTLGNDENLSSAVYEDTLEPSSRDADVYGDRNSNGGDGTALVDAGQQTTSSSSNRGPEKFRMDSRNADGSPDVWLMKKRDFYRMLLRKPCSAPKVKRENVNDTFIRFGKRSVPENEPELQGSDHHVEDGR